MRAVISRQSFEPGRRILAVSDIHGELDYFRALLKKAAFGESDTLVIVGDLLEKGPKSLETLQYVVQLRKKRDVRLVCGNCDWWHTILYSDELRLTQNSMWYVNHKKNNLARQMCEAIGYPVSESMDLTDMRDTLARSFPEEFALLAELPQVIETEHYTFVHGGLPEGEPETWDAWRCMKHDHFMTEGRSFDKWVICGHWPVMLYHEDIVCANPVISRSRRIASIDGGCVLKDDGQLNALVIPYDGSEELSFIAYDPFPTATVLDAQRGSERSYYIRWGDNEVRVLERQGDFCRCRHVRTGYEMDILTKYIRFEGGRAFANDCTDYVLPLSPGDEVSVVEISSRGYFVKHKGVSGWYSGRLKMNGQA
jgi:hypothetical protein